MKKLLTLFFISSVFAGPSGLFAQDHTFVEKGLAIETSGLMGTFDETYDARMSLFKELISPALEDAMLISKVSRYKDSPLKKEAALDILGYIHSDVFGNNDINFNDDGASTLSGALVLDPVTKKHNFDCDTSVYVYLEILELINKDLPVSLLYCSTHMLLIWKLGEDSYINWETTAGIEASIDSNKYYADNCMDVVLGSNAFYSLFYFNRATAKADLKDYVGAINDYSKTIELNPKDHLAYYNRGFMKEKLKHYQEAIIDFDTAIELNPKDACYYYDRGLSKFYLKNYAGGIADYDKTIELDLDQEYEFVYNFRGTAKFLNGDNAGAIVDFNKALELNPKDAFAYYGRGAVKRMIEDYSGAIYDLNKALELDPQNEPACEELKIIQDKLASKY